jgi:hypothetical protein
MGACDAGRLDVYKQGLQQDNLFGRLRVMRKMRLHILNTFIALLICAAYTVAQDDILQKYVPDTLAQVAKRFTASAKQSAEQIFAEDDYSIRARVAYSGSSRRLSDKKRAFLTRWLKDNEYPSEFINKFEDEYLFREDGVDYWLVMQDVVTPHFIEEIKKGGTVDLYIALLGAVKEGGGSNFVMLVNEFKLPDAERPSGPRNGKAQGGSAATEEGGGDTIKGFERYKPRTLGEIIKAHSDSQLLKQSDVLLTGDTFPSRVKVVYTGSSRKITPARKQHLDMLVGSFKVDPKVISMYETEMLFIEGTDEHWLPVQERLIPFFEKELKKGEALVLYAEWVGAKKLGGKWEWIFIVNEFQK